MRSIIFASIVSSDYCKAVERFLIIIFTVVFQYLGFSAAVKDQGRRAATEADQKNITEGSSSVQSENDERDAFLQQCEARDLIDFGMIPEFVGRLPIVVAFHSLTEDMLIRILTEPQNALVPQFKKMFTMDEVSFLCVLFYHWMNWFVV